MSVRCKFKLESIKRTASNGASIEMTPVASGSEENKQFFKWTPSGRIEFATVNEAAIEKLEIGKEYYIDITPAG